ncbi:MAG: hypothetical protein J6U53_03645 [Tidjanibacter sp.]|nr:hypothetical protein [Tidjanibacter sp.]
MMRMRNIFALCATLVGVALGVSSCGSSLTLALSGNTNATTYVDDLYATHDREALREAERLAAEKLAKEKAEHEKRIAALVAASNAGADIDEILDLSEEGIAATGGVISTNEGGDINITYNSIYVDDYESAYARRLQGFTSLTYRMPSSYWNFRYSDAYFLTLAYDPAFYTVMVVGDSVWVEPRYITNMFGSWNNPYYYGYRYGYNPYYYGYSYGYWDYWAWNSPYWACDPFFRNPYYHPYYHNWYAPHYHHHHHYHPAGPDGHHKRPNVTHRPSYGNSAGGGSSMRPSGSALSYNDRLGGRGGTEIVTPSKGTSSSSSVRPSARPAAGTIQSGVTAGRGGTTVKPATKGELSGSLSGTTIKTNPTRGGGTSGVSNSSTRPTRSSGTTIRSTTTTTSAPKKSSSAVKRSSSSSSSSSRSSYSSSSSSSSRSSYSSGNSSSTSRGSYSSGSGSTSRGSYSSGGGSRGGSSTRSGR